MKRWHAVYIYIYIRKLDGRGQIGPNKFRFINIECFDIDYLIEIIFLALVKRMIERSFVVNGFLRSLIYLRADANFIKCFKIEANTYTYISLKILKIIKMHSFHNYNHNLKRKKKSNLSSHCSIQKRKFHNFQNRLKFASKQGNKNNKLELIYLGLVSWQ